MEALWQGLENLYQTVLAWVQGFVTNFSYLLAGEYYGGLFEKYFSVGGFLLGLILVLILYFANPDSDHPYKGFFRVLAMVAVLNCCDTLNILLCGMLGKSYVYGDVSGLATHFFAADNLLSGCILTLVVTNDMYRKPRCAVLMGLAARVTLLLLHYDLLGYLGSVMTQEAAAALAVYMLAQIVVIPLLCWIMCYRRCFYTAWIWYFCAHMLLRLGYFFLKNWLLFRESGMAGLNLVALGDYLGSLAVDYGIFALVLAVGIFFEKGVVVKKRRRAGA